MWKDMWLRPRCCHVATFVKKLTWPSLRLTWLMMWQAGAAKSWTHADVSYSVEWWHAMILKIGWDGSWCGFDDVIVRLAWHWTDLDDVTVHVAGFDSLARYELRVLQLNGSPGSMGWPALFRWGSIRVKRSVFNLHRPITSRSFHGSGLGLPVFARIEPVQLNHACQDVRLMPRTRTTLPCLKNNSKKIRASGIFVS